MNTKREMIISARKQKGWTQEKLATKAGISRAYLANIEQGKYDPSLKVAQKLSKVLGISTDDAFHMGKARKTSGTKLLRKEVI